MNDMFLVDWEKVTSDTISGNTLQFFVKEDELITVKTENIKKENEWYF